MLGETYFSRSKSFLNSALGFESKTSIIIGQLIGELEMKWLVFSDFLNISQSHCFLNFFYEVLLTRTPTGEERGG